MPCRCLVDAERRLRQTLTAFHTGGMEREAARYAARVYRCALRLASLGSRSRLGNRSEADKLLGAGRSSSSHPSFRRAPHDQTTLKHDRTTPNCLRQNPCWAVGGITHREVCAITDTVLDRPEDPVTMVERSPPRSAADQRSEDVPPPAPPLTLSESGVRQ